MAYHDAMRKRDYGQFCGLARAAEVLGQRWTLLILRDLMVGSRRYSDLAAGLPGIPSNLLSTRLKELEQDGLVAREVRQGSDHSIVYALTPRGRELEPVLVAISRWGAAGMHRPRDGEIVTEASLVSALRVASTGAAVPDRSLTFTIEVADVVAHARIRDGVVTIGGGSSENPDLVIVGGPAFRDLLAGVVDPAAALSDGTVAVEGDPDLLPIFTSIFSVPYSEHVMTSED